MLLLPGSVPCACVIFFLIEAKFTEQKMYHLNHFSVYVGGIKCICTVVQISPIITEYHHPQKKYYAH